MKYDDLRESYNSYLTEVKKVDKKYILPTLGLILFTIGLSVLIKLFEVPDVVYLIIIAVVFVFLVFLNVSLNKLRKETALKFGLQCPKCQFVFSSNTIIRILMKRTCPKCKAEILEEEKEEE